MSALDGDYAVVREIYNSENSSRQFEEELERAIDDEKTTIIIEPYQLGEETTRWIRFGNFLHKAAVLSGVTSIATSFFTSRLFSVTVPFGTTSVACATLYALSWSSDPCCKYQIDYSGRALHAIPQRDLGSGSPVVLVRKDDKYRKRLHYGVAIVSFLCCGWQIYRWWTD